MMGCLRSRDKSEFANLPPTRSIPSCTKGLHLSNALAKGDFNDGFGLDGGGECCVCVEKYLISVESEFSWTNRSIIRVARFISSTDR